MIRIDRNSHGTVLLMWLFALASAVCIFVFVRNPWIKWPLLLIPLWVGGWQTMFHRIPRRRKSGDSVHVSAVSDGKVVFVGRDKESEYLGRECLRISVYMDFWDVHANFWPVDGEVTYYKYYPGKHFLAFKPKASEENEHSCTCIRTAEGREVVFKQLAGGFARRIVCYSQPGMKVRAGDQCGIIKFGSRIDYFLPLDTDVKMLLHQHVKACETILAELR